MSRLSLLTLVVGIMSGTAVAGEVKGTVKKIDTQTRQLTITLEDSSDKTFVVSRDAEIYRQGPGRQNKPGPKQFLAEGLASVTIGMEVTLTTFRSGENDVASSVKVAITRKRKP